jgi:LPXTG-motif cell wall-anchored protein
LDKASISVKVNADKVGSSFGAIEGVFTGTPATGEDSNTILTIVSIAESVLKAILGFFAKKEKD